MIQSLKKVYTDGKILPINFFLIFAKVAWAFKLYSLSYNRINAQEMLGIGKKSGSK